MAGATALCPEVPVRGRTGVMIEHMAKVITQRIRKRTRRGTSCKRLAVWFPEESEPRNGRCPNHGGLNPLWADSTRSYYRVACAGALQHGQRAWTLLPFTKPEFEIRPEVRQCSKDRPWSRLPQS